MKEDSYFVKANADGTFIHTVTCESPNMTKDVELLCNIFAQEFKRNVLKSLLDSGEFKMADGLIGGG